MGAGPDCAPDSPGSGGTGTWALVSATTNAGVAYRVTGLAGEAAFFALLSLPPSCSA